MNELEALLQGQIAPQAISLEQLVQLALQYPDPTTAEYAVIDLATNVLLASYLNQAQEYL
ncbi:hypothetical protein [uncultured Acinetobacter sp.]|uniref:hypothetical protein n=1 Tax=uncultured Acinetobacter sp. TaxID=165433 RepID=UPI00262A2014|nr:hypothetical protein [uncultured Acinetobacter sp.]